jgi:acetylcholinesterase
MRRVAAYLALSQQVIAASATTPTVNLTGYGSFQGLAVNSSLANDTLPAPVDAWLGIDYAVQPVGDGRFRPVEARPTAFEGVRPATTYGKVCVQDPLMVPYDQDEACLSFNVFRTADIPLDEKLPTLVWIHGGGFVAGSARSLDGASFVASSENPVAVVTFNYRINSLGFLPSTLFEEEGLLNLGLLDQRFLLEFLQEHLSSFGGDPKQITLGGRSAGAHSVGIHYSHNYGNDTNKPLFARVIHQSGSVTARGFPNATYPQYQSDFARFMSALNCSLSASNTAALSCLRSAPISKIQSESAQMYTDGAPTIAWPFQPTLGGPLLERPGSISTLEGTFFHLPAITSHVTNEGKFYTPGTLQSNDDFLNFMQQTSPYLNTTDIAIINDLYQDPIAHPTTSPYTSSPNSTQYNRLSEAWSDYAYICPSRNTAQVVSRAGVPVWRLRFNTPDTPLQYQSWRGIPHTSDTRYTWASQRTAFPETAEIYHAYLASFVTMGDPNGARLEGTPEWPVYDAGMGGEAEQLVVNPGRFTVVERDGYRREQCEFWNSGERAGRLNK